MEKPSLINNQAEVDFSVWKVSVIAAAGILPAALFGFFLGNNQILYAVIFGALFLAVFVLQAFLIKSGNIGGLIVIAESLGLAIPFFMKNFSFLMLGAWLLCLFFLWLGNSLGKKELGNQLKIHFLKVEKLITPNALNAIIILISVFYASSFFSGNTGVVKAILNSTLQSSEPLIQKIALSDFSFGMSAGKLLESIAVKQLGDKLNLLPPAQRAAALSQTFNELKSMAAGYGLVLEKNETVLNVIDNYVLGFSGRIPEQSKIYFILALVFAILIILKSFGFLAHWILVGPIYLFYQILVVFGFAKISLESRSREIILLS